MLLAVHRLAADIAAALQVVDRFGAVLAVDIVVGPLAVGMPEVALEVEVLPVDNSDNGNNTIDYIAVYNSLDYRIADIMSFSSPL